MEIYPAIDLKNGQCVRLTQGDFATAKIYEPDPMAQARKFAEAGARWLHMVDLDGARDGGMRQFDTIAAVARQTALKIQIGGGVRDAAAIEKLFDAGVARVVIGSLAVQDKNLVKKWLRHFGGERLTLAFDVKFADGEPEVMTHGWQSGSRQLLWDVLEAYEGSGLQNILCTDVGRDGMLAGTNHALYAAIRERWPGLNVLASGGVDGIGDVLALARQGLAGVVVGKALYENRLDLAAAIRQAAHAG